MQSRTDDPGSTIPSKSLSSLWVDLGENCGITIKIAVKDAFLFVNSTSTASLVAVTANLYVTGAIRFLLEVGQILHYLLLTSGAYKHIDFRDSIQISLQNWIINPTAAAKFMVTVRL